MHCGSHVVTEGLLVIGTRQLPATHSPAFLGHWACDLRTRPLINDSDNYPLTCGVRVECLGVFQMACAETIPGCGALTRSYNRMG